jgi:hypothetical protein
MAKFEASGILLDKKILGAVHVGGKTTDCQSAQFAPFGCTTSKQAGTEWHMDSPPPLGHVIEAMTRMSGLDKRKLQ